MPRPPRARRVRRPREITAAQRFHLVKGFDYFDEFPFESQEQRRRVWFENRAELMARKATEDNPGDYEDPRFPAGEMPAAYFDYEGDIKCSI
jgi:hypothetical protein